ncbi:hypothetical protein DPMN_189674 [Dreissena polymorpha]|uniref:Uncharacterized protein n=1 Tax=Dreissena polymorpha TaxID=45954 RepID=A0A9D4DTK7_DREPO|nr:hypothetical protein DPMN_189674 [Dreissena polymorpha]
MTQPQTRSLVSHVRTSPSLAVSQTSLSNPWRRYWSVTSEHWRSPVNLEIPRMS